MSILRYTMKCAMLLLVPLNVASTKILRWFDNTLLFSISRSVAGSTVYQHPMWPSYIVSFEPNDIIPSLISVADVAKNTDVVRRMFVLKNSRLEKTLYTGTFSDSAPKKKLDVLFVYVEEEQCTSFFDNCYVSCEVTADDVIRMVGIRGKTVRVIDDCFEDVSYTSNDVVFSI